MLFRKVILVYTLTSYVRQYLFMNPHRLGTYQLGIVFACNKNLSDILSECVSLRVTQWLLYLQQRALSYSQEEEEEQKEKGTGLLSTPPQGVLRSTFLISSLAETVSHGQDYLPERPGNVIFS